MPKTRQNHDVLEPHQAAALLDILVSKELYFSEVARFNKPFGIDRYGPPFDENQSKPSSSPILQTLLYRFILPLPGFRDLPHRFWKNAKILMKNFSAAVASQSFEQSRVGLRRSLGSGSSTLLEYPARGVLGGLKKTPRRHRKHYNLDGADDLEKAFRDLIQEVVYHQGIDPIFDKIAETSHLKHHDSMIQASHEYILIHIASVLHNVFVIGPHATYLRNIVSIIVKQFPWRSLGQSLKLANAASIIKIFTSTFLTKISITAVLNWMGFSNNPNDGMNLLQQVASRVFSWDIASCEKQLTKIASNKYAPSSEHLENFKEYVELDADKQERWHQRGMHESKSIVTVICEKASLQRLDGYSHTLALKYLELCASVHGRQELARLVCESQPDLITQSIKDLFKYFDPIIRKLHQSVDLSTTVYDADSFFRDFLGLFDLQENNNTDSGVGRDNKKEVTINDFTDLLRRHQSSVHRFCHQFFKNGGDVAESYREYMKSMVLSFQVPKSDTSNTPNCTIPSASLSASLDAMIVSLKPEQQERVKLALDNYSAYLSALSAVSADRLQELLEGNDLDAGPGAFLAKWHHLEHEDPPHSIEPEGSRPRHESPKPREVVENENGYGTDRRGGAKDSDHQWQWPEFPAGMDVATKALGSKFRKLLGEIGLQYWMVARDAEYDSDLD